LRYLMIKNLLFLANTFIFMVFLFASGTVAEIKKETIKFSSETALIKKKDGVLHLSGNVEIEYGRFLIKSDFLVAKTNNNGLREIEIIEAERNIYFSNSDDIVAKGDNLFMDVARKIASIDGNVEFTQRESIIRADKINVDLETETVDFEGIKDSFIKN